MNKEIWTSDCYVPNNDPYPLCVGLQNNKTQEDCNNCCLYQDMKEEKYWGEDK